MASLTHVQALNSRQEERSALQQRAVSALECREKFLRFFPGGFRDQKYLAWERGYKWKTHLRWEESLGQAEYRSLLRRGQVSEIAARATRIESRTHLLFSFEKMALRDAVKSAAGARAFAHGLYDFLHGSGIAERRFERWCKVVEGLPHKQSRVLTWPVVTVFGFIAQPETHVFFKPRVTSVAARKYGVEFNYRSRPSWETYAELLEFAGVIRRDLRDLRPNDMIDIQSFIWVNGSDEYSE